MQVSLVKPLSVPAKRSKHFDNFFRLAKKPSPRQNFFVRFFGKLTSQWQSVVRPIIYGVAAGLAAVAFQRSIHWLYDNGIVRFSKMDTWEFLLYSFLVLAGTSALAGTLISRFCPDAAGSGSPQVKLAFWKDFGFMRLRTALMKFIGSALSVGGGASLGNEGPMVQIGGGVASNVAGTLGVPAHLRREATAAGAAAGLAAIFNAPMAAVAFVLEEVVENLNSRLIGAILLAAVTGALVAHFFMGDAAVFTIPATEHASWHVYVFTPFTACVATLAGILFQKTALRIRKFGKTTLQSVPVPLRIVAGAICVWALGSIVFLSTGHLGVFFLGYDDLSAALNAELAWWLAGLLLAAKLAATAFCYGLGGCGGIFAPSLFFGGTCGAAFAGALALFVPGIGSETVSALAVVGMCSCFGAVVRAPVAGVLLVFEMTHNFALVPALMLGGMISVVLSKILSEKGFYDEILSQDGKEISKVIPPRDLHSWQRSPVSRIANFSPVLLTELSEEAAGTLLKETRFSRVPVVDADERLRGIATRAELNAACARNDPGSALLHPAPCCSRETPICEVEKYLIDSEDGIVAVTDPAGRVIGIVTLHDIIRAEMNFSER